MATVGYAALQIVPSMRGVGATIEGQLNSVVGGAGTKAGASLGSKLFGGVGKFAKVGVAAVGAVAGAVTAISVKGGISRALNIEDAQAKLKGLGHSQGEVTKIMGSALDSVRGTAFGLDAAATVAATAVAAGVKPGKELTKYLSLTADTATIAGTSMGEMGSVINQVMAKGKADTQDLYQLSDRGIPIFSLLQKEYGVTGGELAKMVADGKVDSKTYLKVLQENLGGAALKSANTTRGAFANMGSALSRFGVILTGPFLPFAKVVFQQITVAVDALAKAIGPAMTEFTTYFAGTAGPALSSFGDTFAAMIGQVGSGGGQLTAVLSGLSPVLTIIRGAAPALAPLGPLFLQLGQALGGTLAAILPSLGAAFLTLGQALGTTLAAALPAVVSLLVGFAGTIQTLAPQIGGLVTGVASFVAVVLQLVTPLLSSEGALKSAVFALLLWKAATAGVSLAVFIEGLASSTAGLATNTAAFAVNSAAKLKSAAETVYIAGLYAGSFLAGLARSTAGLVANSAAWVANAAAQGAAKVASGASAVVGVVASLGASTAALAANAGAWVANAAAQVAAKAAGGASAVAGVVASLAAGTATLVANTAAWVVNTAVQVAQRAAVIAGAAAMAIARGAVLAWTAVQWLLNAALLANPIGLIIIAVAAFVAGIILAYQHSATFRAIVQGAWAGIQVAIAAVVAFITGVVVPGIIAGWNLLKAGVLTLLSIYASVFNGIRAVVGAVVGFVVGFVVGQFNMMRAGVSAVLNGIRAANSAVWNAVRAIVSGVVNGVRSVVTSGFNGVRAAVLAAWNAVKSTTTAAWNAVRTAVASGVSKAVAVVKSLPGKAKSALGNVGGLLSGAGGDLVRGFINGMSGAIGAVAAKAREMASAAIRAAKSALDSHSPSRVFVKIGGDTGAGLGIGISRSVSGVVASVRGVAATVATTARKVLAAGDPWGGLAVPAASRVAGMSAAPYAPPTASESTGGDQVLQVENLGYNPDEIFTTWNRKARGAARRANLHRK